MNLYEHTIVIKQDVGATQIKKLTEKYSKIVESNDGNIVQTENWGLLNLSYIIKKIKKLTTYISKSKVVEKLSKSWKKMRI